MSSYSPAALLGELGIPVLSARLRDTWGAWSPVHRKIVVAVGLSPIQKRCVLAHEVEHVLAHDAACGFGFLTDDQERHAEAKAALKLIAAADLAVAAKEAGDPHEAACLLGVTVRTLRIRLADLQGECPSWLVTSKIAG